MTEQQNERSTLERFSREVDDLIWRFQCASADLGIHGQSIDGGGGGVVFDEMASNRKHLKLRTRHHRWAVERMARVDAALAAVAPGTARELAHDFDTYGRASKALTDTFTVRLMSGTDVCMLARATRLPLTVAAYDRDDFDRRRPNGTIIDWLEAIRLTDRGKEHIANARDRAEESLAEILVGFAAVAREQAQARRRAKREQDEAEAEREATEQAIARRQFDVRAGSVHAQNLTEIAVLVAQKLAEHGQ